MRGSIQEAQNFDAHKIVNTLWAKTDTQLPDVFEALCANFLRFLASRFEAQVQEYAGA